MSDNIYSALVFLGLLFIALVLYIRKRHIQAKCKHYYKGTDYTGFVFCMDCLKELGNE